MANIQLSFSGGSYKHKSVPLSAQRTVNLWPQKIKEAPAFSDNILIDFPRLKLRATDASGQDRGLYVHKEILYRVCGTVFFKVNQAGTHTSLGTIPGSNRVVFSAVADTIIVVNSGTVYTYNVLTGTFQEETDSDFETPNGVTSLNSQAIYDGDRGRWVVSDAGTAADLTSTNYATLESVAQDIVRPYAKNQIVFLFGQIRIEPWWNSGDGNPPFNRVESGIIEVGLKAFHSIGETKDALYFYGSDDQIYILQGYNAVAVSTTEMAAEFKTYAAPEKAVGFCITHEGKNFYIITFPDDDRTWVYHEGEEWFELRSGDGRWYGNSAVYAYGKNLIADYRNGNIYELDPDTHLDNGDTVIRTRVTSPIHGGLIGASGKRIFLNALEFFMETGVGALSGEGQTPHVMVSISRDGGRTFDTEMQVPIGLDGQYQQKVEVFALGSFYNGVIKVSFSDPVPFALYGGRAEIEVGI